MVALDSRCRQVDFDAQVPSTCCKWLSGETPASSSWTSPSFPSPRLPRRLHPHMRDFCCPLQVRSCRRLRLGFTASSTVGREGGENGHKCKRKKDWELTISPNGHQFSHNDMISRESVNTCSCSHWFFSPVQDPDMSLFFVLFCFFLQFIMYHIIYTFAMSYFVHKLFTIVHSSALHFVVPDKNALRRNGM